MDDQRPIRSDDDYDDCVIQASFSLLPPFNSLDMTDDSPVSRLLHVLVIKEVHPVLVRTAHTVEAEEYRLPGLVPVEVTLDIDMYRPHILKVDNVLTQLGLRVTHDQFSREDVRDALRRMLLTHCSRQAEQIYKYLSGRVLGTDGSAEVTMISRAGGGAGGAYLRGVKF